MSNQRNIRWRNKDIELLKKSVKNFNAKAKYHYNKYERNSKRDYAITVEGRAIPTPFKYADLRDRITTRADFNRVIKTLQKFSEKGQEELVPLPLADDRDPHFITKWELDTLKELSKHETVMVNKVRERWESRKRRRVGQPIDVFTINGKIVGSSEYHQLQPKEPFVKSGGAVGSHARLKSIMIRSLQGHWDKKDVMCRENYIKALRQNYGEFGISKDIIKAINEMSLEEFIEIFESEVGEFEWLYHESFDTQLANLDVLERIWLNREKKVIVDEKTDTIDPSKIYDTTEKGENTEDNKELVVKPEYQLKPTKRERKYRSSSTRRTAREARKEAQLIKKGILPNKRSKKR